MWQISRTWWVEVPLKEDMMGHRGFSTGFGWTSRFRFWGAYVFWKVDLLKARSTETRSHRKTSRALKQRFLSKRGGGVDLRVGMSCLQRNRSGRKTVTGDGDARNRWVSNRLKETTKVNIMAPVSFPWFSKKLLLYSLVMRCLIFIDLVNTWIGSLLAHYAHVTYQMR